MENVKEYLEPVSKVALDVKEKVRQPSYVFLPPPLFSRTCKPMIVPPEGSEYRCLYCERLRCFQSRGDVVKASLGQTILGPARENTRHVAHGGGVFLSRFCC